MFNLFFKVVSTSHRLHEVTRQEVEDAIIAGEYLTEKRFSNSYLMMALIILRSKAREYDKAAVN